MIPHKEGPQVSTDLTLQAIEAETRSVADEFPFHKAELCVYVAPDANNVLQPMCILGHALVRLGVSPEMLAGHDETDFKELAPYLGLSPHHPVTDWLLDVQHLQDGSYAQAEGPMAWANAVDEADNVVEQEVAS